MTDDRSTRAVSRRRLLAASGVTLAMPLGSGVGAAEDGDEGGGSIFDRCPDATKRPSMGHCDGATMSGCADDHPETVVLQANVEEVLENRYPDAGSLLDDGFKPYFDTFVSGDTDDPTETGGWSHWLSPEYIGDDAVLDPERPESVLVDNESWRSIGVMFIATRDGEPVDPPPAVYGADVAADGRDDDGHDQDDSDDGDDHGHNDGFDHDDGERDDHDTNGDRCSPWHYHAGFPGRFAWWYYRQVYEGAVGDGDVLLPCRTPCMMHVWTVPHPEGVYAHDGPPLESRRRPPADEAGFDTDATPGEDRLGWDALPDEHVPDLLPSELRAGWE